MTFFDISVYVAWQVVSDPAHDLYGPGNSTAAITHRCCALRAINTKDELLEGSHVLKSPHHSNEDEASMISNKGSAVRSGSIEVYLVLATSCNVSNPLHCAIFENG